MKYCPNPECPGQPKPGIASEFVDDVYRCSDCGTTLVQETDLPESMRRPRQSEENDAASPDGADIDFAGAGPTDATDELSPGAWVPVEANLFPQEAHIARGILENEGIEVMVADENRVSVIPFLMIAGQGARVCVRRADLERAEQLLESAEAGSREVTEESEEAGTAKPSPES